MLTGKATVDMKWKIVKDLENLGAVSTL